MCRRSASSAVPTTHLHSPGETALIFRLLFFKPVSASPNLWGKYTIHRITFWFTYFAPPPPRARGTARSPVAQKVHGRGGEDTLKLTSHTVSTNCFLPQMRLGATQPMRIQWQTMGWDAKERWGGGTHTFHLVVAEDLLHPEAVHKFQQRENRGQVVSFEVTIPRCPRCLHWRTRRKAATEEVGECVSSPKTFQISRTNTHLEEKSVTKLMRSA